MAGMVGAPLRDRSALFAGLGMTPEVARDVATAVDDVMARCILSLYRSAAQPVMAELGSRLADARSRPGLVIIATEDGYTGGEARARWAADQARAAVSVLPGLGHWWMLQDPAAGASVLRDFLASVR